MEIGMKDEDDDEMVIMTITGTLKDGDDDNG